MCRRPIVAVLILMAASTAIAADDFYEQQLRAAKADYQANRLAQATDELRIAAFGFLDRPALLQEALARLAVAQETLGRTEERSKAIERFLMVEQRFASYHPLALEAPIRSAFEKLLSDTVPHATLVAMPGLASIANFEIRKVAELPENKRIAAYEAGAQRESKNIEWRLALAREYAAKDDQAQVIRWGTRALELDSKNQEARALVAHARASRREYREALVLITDADLKARPDLYADQTVSLANLGRYKEAQAAFASVPDRLKRRPDVQKAAELISKNTVVTKPAAKSEPVPPKPAPVVVASAPPDPVAPDATEVLDLTHRLIHDGRVDEAFSRLRAAVDSEPDNRSLRLALLEAAVLSKDWQTAASQVPKVTPLAAGEELWMFYSSVALYETGQKQQARPLMERARSHMVPSPIVNYYLKAILGQTG